MKIEIKNIQKRYRAGKKNVLKNVNFYANAGECIGILGANGCGKTTLLSILAGVLKPDSGEFFIDDVDVLKKRKMVSQAIGYVPQGNPLMEELTAKDNLKLWYCDSRLDMNKELENGVLNMLGISDFINVRVSRMSGGMKKRLSIGCSVANDPPILILDEPGASLDLQCKENIVEYLKFFKKRGGIIIIATHEEREIDLCDRIYIMKDGVLGPHKYEGVSKLIENL